MSRQYVAIPNIFEAITIPGEGILKQTVHQDPDVKIIAFGFAPGHELAVHAAPMPATIQVLQGEAEVTLDEDSVQARAGSVIHMQPNLRHGIVAKTPVLMLLTLIKASSGKAA